MEIKNYRLSMWRKHLWFWAHFGVRLHVKSCFFSFLRKNLLQLQLQKYFFYWNTQVPSVFFKNRNQKWQVYSGWTRFQKFKLCPYFRGWWKKSPIWTFKKFRDFWQFSGQSWSNLQVFKCFRVIGEKHESQGSDALTLKG